MPKVRGETVYIGGTKFFREFHVNAGGTFTSKLPPDVAAALGRAEIHANTLDSAISAWDAAKVEYEGLKTTSRKVIVYHVAMKTQLPGLYRQDLHFTSGMALDFACGVYEERCLHRRDGNGASYYRYDYVESSIPEDFRGNERGLVTRDSQPHAYLVPWTQEREDWFLGLCLAYEKLLRGLNELFKDNAALTEGIAGGRLLVGGPTS